MLACDIITLIFDIETNVRVSKLAYVFKCMAHESGIPQTKKKLRDIMAPASVRVSPHNDIQPEVPKASSTSSNHVMTKIR